MSVAVCSNLPVTSQTHRQIGLDRMIASETLDSVMVSMLTPVGVGTVIESGNLSSEMVNTLA